MTSSSDRDGRDGSAPPAVLDRQVLAVLCDGADSDEMEMLRRVVASYCSGRLVAEARDALQSRDWEGCERSAHSLKGLSATLGANAVAAAAARLEEHAGCRDLGACQSQIEQVAAEHERSHRALAATDMYDPALLAELVDQE